ncbi:MAG: AbrB/MazE/SpoVT family DNA-binding domain-containing protein [archaeon]
MARIDMTKMSSKGQVVIPLDLRMDMREGDKIVMIRNGKQIIMKKADDFDENIEGDLEFAKRTEAAWERIEAGEYVSVDSEKLFEEMSKW